MSKPADKEEEKKNEPPKPMSVADFKKKTMDAINERVKLKETK